MDIRDGASHIPGADHIHGPSTRDSGKATAARQATSAEAAHQPKQPDTVSISQDAPAEVRHAVEARELAFARKALAGSSATSDERLGEIRNRLNSGFYLKPEVTREVAQEISTEMGLDAR